MTLAALHDNKTGLRENNHDRPFPNISSTSQHRGGRNLGRTLFCYWPVIDVLIRSEQSTLKAMATHSMAFFIKPE